MLLTESKLTGVLTEGLKYHLETKTPLYKNVFRPGSEEYFKTINQARLLMNEGVLTDLCLEDMELLFETEVGTYGEYNGQIVPLDFPMLNEITMVIPSPATSWREASQEPLVMKMGEERWMDLAGKAKAAGGLGYQTKYSDIKTFLGELPTGTVTFSDTDQVQMPTALKFMDGNQVSYKLIAGENILASILPEDPDPDMWVVDITGEAQETPLQELMNQIREADMAPNAKVALVKKIIDLARKQGAHTNINDLATLIARQIEINPTSKLAPGQVKVVGGTKVDEAKYKGKEVKLNKPMRSSGPKKYKVYTKNAKGNVIVVNFGDAKGGLTAKINNAKARKAFSDRHNCPSKKDKTKAGYWSCRLPRYASLLGLKSSFGGYW